MSDCLQGKHNSDSIHALTQLLAEQNTRHLMYVEKTNDKIGTLQVDITEIKTMLKVKIDYMENEISEEKGKVKNHLDKSEDRIKEYDKNTSFRIVGVWAIGILFANVMREIVVHMTK